MKLTVTSGVPEGSYLGKFVRVEPTTNDFGEGLKWIWEITTGQQAGQIASCTTSTNPSAKNRCGKVVTGMLGKSLPNGEELDTDMFVGRTYLLIVRKGESGGTFVDSVTQAPVA
jgi:hypothetical protein